jgi:hypothetical protein
LEPPELAALYGIGEVAESRPEKYLGSLKLWPISDEPTALPSLTVRLCRRPDRATPENDKIHRRLLHCKMMGA